MIQKSNECSTYLFQLDNQDPDYMLLKLLSTGICNSGLFYCVQILFASVIYGGVWLIANKKIN